MPEESYDTANPFRGRIFRPRAGCCSTTAPPTRDARQDPRWLLWTLIRIARERYAPPTAAGWQSPRIAGKTAPPAFPPPPAKPQSFLLPPPPPESRRPG